MQARLLYRDGLMLVIDKPAGVAVHRGPKGGASLEDDFDALRFGLPRKPALAHRLDRDTAGCLVLGRHHKALEKLGLLFKQGKISKTYWAIVAGGPAERRRPDRQTAGAARRDARLVDEGRRERPAVADALAGSRPRPMARRADRLARTDAADRPHPPIARPLRQRGLADPRRRDLRRARRLAPATAGAAGRSSARPRTSRRSSSRRRRRRICARRWRPAATPARPDADRQRACDACASSTKRSARTAQIRLDEPRSLRISISESGAPWK